MISVGPLWANITGDPMYDTREIRRMFESGVITDREYIGLVLDSYGPEQIRNRVYRRDYY